MSYSPSLSTAGKLHQSKKFDLLSCLESQEPTRTAVTGAPPTDVKVIDGAAAVYFLSVGEARTFGEYSKEVFIPYIRTELEKCNRINIVWDVYLRDSLKITAHENRGTGVSRRVSSSVKLMQIRRNYSSSWLQKLF